MDKRRILQTARTPLLVMEQQTTQTLPQITESDEDMLTPTSSRSSSSTSLASSISPITPLARYQKRLQGEDADKEKKVQTVKVDLKTQYQQLMTKYFKAKKTIRRLKDQNKYDQRRISLLEFSRQQEAMLVQLSESETVESQEPSKGNDSESKNEYGDDGVNDTTKQDEAISSTGIENDNEFSAVLVTNDSDIICESDIVDKVNESCVGLVGHAINSSFNISVYSDTKDELVKRMAAVISDQSLRPIIFNVPQESPPSKMIEVIEKLSKSGRCCQRCGNKILNNNK